MKCITSCSLALLCPDGTVRCERNFNIVDEVCPEREPGVGRIYDPYGKKEVITQEKQSYKTKRVKQVRIKVPKPKVEKSKKPIQGTMF